MNARKIISLVLSLIICAAFMPADSFAGSDRGYASGAEAMMEIKTTGSDDPDGNGIAGSDDPVGIRTAGSDEPGGNDGPGSDDPDGNGIAGSDDPAGIGTAGSDDPDGIGTAGSEEPGGGDVAGGDEPGGNDVTGGEDEEYVPVTLVLKLEEKTYNSISLSWNKDPKAAHYTLEYSTDGKTWKKAASNLQALKYTHKNRKPVSVYYYRIYGYPEDETIPKSESAKNLIVKTLRAKTKVKGVLKKKSIKARNVLKDKVVITAPLGRKLQLQEKVDGKWVVKKKIKLKDTTGKQTLKIKYTNSWWKKNTTKWRYVIKANKRATGYKSKTITVKTRKYYQNPSRYVQLRNKISKHGHHYYTSPVLTNNASTREDHVEAMIRTARKFLGDSFVVCRSRAPGRGVDCSGLVMQACYGAGVDLYPSNPYRHQFRKYEYESRYIARKGNLKTVRYRDRKRGDLIFYSKGGIVIHIAIYLGNNRIIHSWPGHVRISRANSSRWGHISKVKRVFN